MDTVSTISPVSLAQTYAKYFIEDFSSKVMRHLQGSYPLPPEKIQDFVAQKVANLVNSDTPIALANSDTICRFLYECADYALSHDIPDPTSREAWDKVSSAPSIHHAEISTMVYNSATLYRRTLESTLIGVIVRDAVTAAKAIENAAQTRITSVETGGSIHQFTWGILNDGLWLNGALLRAFDLARVFRAGDPVVNYYATTAYEFAAQYAAFAMLNKEDQASASAEIDRLLDRLPEDAAQQLLDGLDRDGLKAMLFQVGYMSDMVRIWTRGLNSTPDMISSTLKLSYLARLLSKLIDTYRSLDSDEEVVGDLVRERLHQAQDVVILALVGYEALRETKYAETVILDVVAPSNDPKVDVYVNSDMVNSYRAAGGDDADLIRFGVYLDPRTGMSTSSTGWNLSFILARKDDVIPKVIAADAERLERLRNNDASVIQAEALRVIETVVDSYLSATNASAVRPDINQNIHKVIRQVTDGNTVMSLPDAITGILVSIIDDPYLTSLSVMLTNNLSSGDDYTREQAVPLTIAEMAVNDAYSYIATDPDS